MENINFSDFNVSEELKRGLMGMGFTAPTDF